MSNFNYSKERHLKLLKLEHSQEKVLTSAEESELITYWCMIDGILD